MKLAGKSLRSLTILPSQWMPDFQTVRSHPNVMAAITGGTAAGLGIFYYRRFATKEPAVSAQ